MADIGDCDPITATLPAGNQFPIDPSLDRFDPTFDYNDYLPAQHSWISIFVGSNSTFDYFAYHNEYIGDVNDVIGIVHPEVHKIGGQNAGACNNIEADEDECGNNTSILFPPLRPYNGSEDETGSDINGIANGSLENGLGNAFPNPANSSFIVPFKIEKSFNVASIEVFDLKSAKAVITKKVIGTTGEITISTESLSEGVYMYRLVLDNIPVSTKSIVILK